MNYRRRLLSLGLLLATVTLGGCDYCEPPTVPQSVQRVRDTPSLAIASTGLHSKSAAFCVGLVKRFTMSG